MADADGPTSAVERHRKSGTPVNAGPTSQRSSWLLALLLVASSSAVLSSFDPRLRHWFLIPVTLCGALIGVDAVDWVRRRRDIFDPQAFLGLMGVHFFYLAPILHVMLDHWPKYLVDAPDWPDALGSMAMLNTVGLLVYRLILARQEPAPAVPRPAANLNLRHFYIFGLLAAAVSVTAFLGELAMFGGPAGYLDAVTANLQRTELKGLGWLLILAEAFPMILFVLAVVRWKASLVKRPALVILLLVGLALLQFTAGGLRGSRSNTMWPVLMGLILIHLLVVRISRKAFLAYLLLVGAFVYVYGLYKTAGPEIVDIARGDRTVEEVSSDTGRDLPTMLLGDFGRADIQALLLDRQNRGDGELAYGITYVGDVSTLIPSRLLPDRPTDKAAAATDLVLGPGTSATGVRLSRVYGIAGEAIINFGAVGGVASFVVLGLAIRAYRRFYRRALEGRNLVPKLLAPLLWQFTLLPTADLDNTVWFMLKFVAPVAVVVWLALQHRSESHLAPGDAGWPGGPGSGGRHRHGRADRPPVRGADQSVRGPVPVEGAA
jgi:hypothetical protein